jgi:hypothetical protein
MRNQSGLRGRPAGLTVTASGPGTSIASSVKAMIGTPRANAIRWIVSHDTRDFSPRTNAEIDDCCKPAIFANVLWLMFIVASIWANFSPHVRTFIPLPFKRIRLSTEQPAS